MYMSDFEFQQKFMELADSTSGYLDPNDLIAATPEGLLDNPNEILAYWEGQDLDMFIPGTGVNPVDAIDAMSVETDFLGDSPDFLEGIFDMF